MKVRVTELKINNLKNVLNGSISFPISKSKTFNHADVLGIYGQNGSGKTTVVEAFQILHTLLTGKALEESVSRLINQDTATAALNFSFCMESETKLFEVYYSFDLTKYLKIENEAVQSLETNKNSFVAFVSREEVKYKEIKKGARPKTVIQFLRSNEEDYSVAPLALYNKIRSNKEDYIVAYKVNSQLAFKERTSFLFRSEGIELCKKVVDNKAFQIISALKDVFATNLFVLNNQHSNLTLSNIVIPVHYKKKNAAGYAAAYIQIQSSFKMSNERFKSVSEMFTPISRVLKELVPGLTVELRSLGKETLQDSTPGVQAELVAIRGEKALPISVESEGIKKLVSVLSSLIVMYNDTNACVIIDELDAGVFEFLLGEIVKILNDSGKGQLLFTSHNLRLLEVLNKDNLVFTSTNPENRFINLKGIKDTNNIRDVYIRAIQLGNDEEAVYETTDKYDIMDAFEEAGEIQDA